MHAARTVLALFLIVVLCGVGGALGGASDETEFLTLLYNATCGWEWHDSTGWLEGPPCADDAPAWAGLTCSGGRVTSLALVANNLCGALPEGWGALDALRTLALDANSIGGDLPGTLGQLTALERLSLSHTALSGSLPVSLALLRRLTYLNVSAARLMGSIPTDYGRLTALQTLALASNVLSGAIPTELARLVSAHTVDLSDNALSGTLSPLLVGMRSLTALLLHDNALSGDFPPFIAQFPSLRALSLAANNLSGALPDFFRTESELRNELRAIDPALVNVSANFWTAPPCWCALTTCASLVPGVQCANHSSSSSPEHVAVALIILLTFLVVLTMAVAWARRWQRTRSPTYDTLPQREQGKEAKEAPLLLESDL